MKFIIKLIVTLLVVSFVVCSMALQQPRCSSNCAQWISCPNMKENLQKLPCLPLGKFCGCPKIVKPVVCQNGEVYGNECNACCAGQFCCIPCLM